ncbi:hypothetical protein ACJJTC_001707 [Scirpophaga incertulas]
MFAVECRRSIRNLVLDHFARIKMPITSLLSPYWSFYPSFLHYLRKLSSRPPRTNRRPTSQPPPVPALAALSPRLADALQESHPSTADGAITSNEELPKLYIYQRAEIKAAIPETVAKSDREIEARQTEIAVATASISDYHETPKNLNWKAGRWVANGARCQRRCRRHHQPTAAGARAAPCSVARLS